MTDLTCTVTRLQRLGFASLPVREVLGALVRGAEVLSKHLRK